MLLRDNRSVMQRRWHGQKGGGDLLAWFGPLVFTICEIWGVILREDVFSWGCKTGKKWVQNACEANLTVKTQCFCGSVRDGELCQIDSHRAWMDGWMDILCVQYVCISITFAYRWPWRKWWLLLHTWISSCAAFRNQPSSRFSSALFCCTDMRMCISWIHLPAGSTHHSG